MSNDGNDSADHPVDRHPDEYNLDTFRHALVDARRKHEQQLEAYNDIDEKGWRILQFNGIIATIAMAGAVNVGGNVTAPPLIIFLVAIGLLAYSSYRVLYCQPVKEAILGPAESDLEKISRQNPREPVYLHWVINQYSKWTNTVEEGVKKNSENVERAKLFSMAGTGLLIGGGLLYVTIHLT